MKRWLECYLVALVAAILWYASLWIPSLSPDAFGLALAPFLIGAGLVVIWLVLLSVWASNRYVFKKGMRFSLSVMVLAWTVLCILVGRFGDGRWFGDGLGLFGVHTVPLALPSFAYAYFRLPKTPNQTLEPASGLAPGRGSS